jgi:hypothetical protein
MAAIGCTSEQMCDATSHENRPALGDHEIEVTPEMIEAGVLKLCDYARHSQNKEDIVGKTFSTMRLVERQGRPS